VTFASFNRVDDASSEVQGPFAIGARGVVNAVKRGSSDRAEYQLREVVALERFQHLPAITRPLASVGLKPPVERRAFKEIRIRSVV
jgi:hypothetical protein